MMAIASVSVVTLGLELGEQGLQVSDRPLYFQISSIIILSRNLITLNSSP